MNQENEIKNNNNLEQRKNEEFAKKLRQANKYFLIIIFIGSLTFLFAIIIRITNCINLSDLMQGIYTGFGAGLVGAGIASRIKNIRILKNEECLRKKRIETKDERNQLVNQKARNITFGVMFLVMYISILIVGIWMPIISFLLVGFVIFFLVVYMIAHCIIDKRL